MKAQKSRILTLLCILWIFWIWGHSMMPASLSSAESGSVLALLQGILDRVGTGVELSEHFVRKLAHFLEYLLLGVLVDTTLRVRNQKPFRLPLVTILWLVPFVDESIQLFVPGRGSQVQDIWLDLAGAIVGVILSSVVWSVILHKTAKR